MTLDDLTYGKIDLQFVRAYHGTVILQNEALSWLLLLSCLNKGLFTWREGDPGTRVTLPPCQYECLWVLIIIPKHTSAPTSPEGEKEGLLVVYIQTNKPGKTPTPRTTSSKN